MDVFQLTPEEKVQWSLYSAEREEGAYFSALFEDRPDPVDDVLRLEDRVLISLGFATGYECPKNLYKMWAGWIKDGELVICGSVAKQFYELAGGDEARRKRNEYPKFDEWENEAEFRDCIADHLAACWFDDNCNISKEHRTAHGRIDILIHTGHGKKPSAHDHTVIVETKMACDGHTIAQALGQLMLYRVTYPFAELYIATPKAPDQQLVTTLAGYGVSCMWYDENNNLEGTF